MILIALVVGAVALRRYAFPGGIDLAAVRAFVQGYGPLTFIVAYVVLTTLQAPGTVMNMVAAVAFGFQEGWVLAVICMNVAANVQFFIGRATGLERLKGWFEKKGFRTDGHKNIPTLIALRFIPIPYLWVNVGCGATGVAWPMFAVSTLVGLIVQITAATFFAAQVAEGVEGANTRVVVSIAIAGVIVIGAMLIGRWVRNRWGAKA